MKNRKYILLLLIMFCSLVSRPYALTIKETMDTNDEYSTIEEGSIIIGVTRFSPNNIVTASKAAQAGVDDVMLYLSKNGNPDNYQTPGVYYYVDSYVGWFYLDSENKVTTVTDLEELERLSNLDIYYVDNVEKVLEIEYPNNDIKEDTLPKGVTYKDNKLYINATVEKVEFRTKDEKKVSFIFDSTTSQFIEDTRSCYTVNGSTITDYDPYCGTHVVIPTEINGITITAIGENAFKNTNLISVIIPNTITSIGDNAFANNDLEQVIIKDKYDETEFANYGTNVFGNFNAITYDNILTRISSYLNSHYVINHYKSIDINTVFDEDNDDYILTGYIVNRLIKTLENNGYSKNYSFCGESCGNHENEEDAKNDVYGIGLEKIENYKYLFTIQNYDNNKLNKVTKTINVSFNETGIKSDNDTVLEAIRNLGNIDDNETIQTRMKYIQDTEDLHNIDIILHKRGCGSGPDEDETIIGSTCAYSTYYEKNNVLYQSNIIMLNEKQVYLPKEKIEDYPSIDSYVEYILNQLISKTNITNYEIKEQDNGLIYTTEKEQYYYHYETAKVYTIEIFDKEYLENWYIYFLEFYKDKYNKDGYTEESCFTFDNGVITDYDGTCGINVRIPDTINGVDVIEIGNSVFQYMKLNSVILPNKLQKIGDYAFENNSLTSIEFPNTLKTIGNNAFSMNLLTDVKIPELVEGINYGAFSSNEIENVTFIGNLTTIDNYVFYHNNIKEIEIPSGINTIGISAFEYNEIESLVLPEGLERINDRAFASNKIKELQLPSTLSMLGPGVFTNNQLPAEQAFVYSRKKAEDGPGYIPDYESINSYGGQNRDNIVIPDDVLFIGDYAFYDCDIKSVKLPKSILQIGSYGFAENELTSIDIPYGINLIGDSAFGYNKLTFAVVPDSALNRGWGIFEGNLLEGENSFVYTKNENNKMDYTNLIGYYNTEYQIDEIIIPDTVKKIGDGAFSNVEVKNLVIPYGVEEIGNAAFSRVSVKNLSIPKSVTKIGLNAFNKHYQLTEEEGYIYARNEDGTLDKSILMAHIADIKDGSITIPNGVVEIKENVFYNRYDLNEVILPSTLKKIGKNAFRSNHNLSKVTFNDNLETIGDYAFSYANLKTINLGNNIQSIGANAFEHISSLTSVTIGDGPTEIGNYAFQYNQNLVSLTLGNNIKNIGDYAFYLNKLTEVNIPGTVKTIGEHAFYWNNLSKITLGEGLEKIDNFAFDVNNQVKEVTIPASLTELGNDVFSSGVEKVTVLGKRSEIDFTTFGNNPFGSNATVIYELFEPSLELPTLPLEIHSFDTSYYNIERTYEITEIQHSFSINSNGTYKLDLYLIGNKKYDILGNENTQAVYANIHLRKESNGNTIYMEPHYLDEITVGGEFKTKPITIDNLPSDNFILEIGSH